ncbi:hypothetical protein Aph02nite_42560 [Actinoplanes philippinensis]|uniref:Uncharacterized protein n=1 Tax=Actinoplanes philippinensis TaxID=35752 RepID=A0A1I2H1Z5_9ACTN|nr:serine/threonine-protein phosphatase [Actinoplanes philippinensis]GIE78306.1 hypothetical protein Aph02nite_42560 [Actinoplanes philippinensis]SFF23558.1 hypothetical protein SAMN05421541_107386 [Actinoplanes philippinensis]
MRAGFRVAVGRGFAGRIAAARTAVRLVDVRPGDVVNPILTAKGIRSLLGVPILALQRSLLPARLPSVPSVDLAARYVPGHATGIGGGSLTTALYAMISPGRDRAVISTAGHPCPVLAEPDGAAGWPRCRWTRRSGCRTRSGRGAAPPSRRCRARCCCATPTGWWSGAAR